MSPEVQINNAPESKERTITPEDGRIWGELSNEDFVAFMDFSIGQLQPREDGNYPVISSLQNAISYFQNNSVKEHLNEGLSYRLTTYKGNKLADYVRRANAPHEKGTARVTDYHNMIKMLTYTYAEAEYFSNPGNRRIRPRIHYVTAMSFNLWEGSIIAQEMIRIYNRRATKGNQEPTKPPTVEEYLDAINRDEISQYKTVNMEYLLKNQEFADPEEVSYSLRESLRFINYVGSGGSSSILGEKIYDRPEIIRDIKYVIQNLKGLEKKFPNEKREFSVAEVLELAIRVYKDRIQVKPTKKVDK